jgi:hypothetical protein
MSKSIAAYSKAWKLEDGTMCSWASQGLSLADDERPSPDAELVQVAIVPAGIWRAQQRKVNGAENKDVSALLNSMRKINDVLMIPSLTRGGLTALQREQGELISELEKALG